MDRKGFNDEAGIKISFSSVERAYASGRGPEDVRCERNLVFKVELGLNRLERLLRRLQGLLTGYRNPLRRSPRQRRIMTFQGTTVAMARRSLRGRAARHSQAVSHSSGRRPHGSSRAVEGALVSVKIWTKLQIVDAHPWLAGNRRSPGRSEWSLRNCVSISFLIAFSCGSDVPERI
jgi:hypothetical protein